MSCPSSPNSGSTDDHPGRVREQKARSWPDARTRSQPTNGSPATIRCAAGEWFAARGGSAVYEKATRLRRTDGTYHEDMKHRRLAAMTDPIHPRFHPRNSAELLGFGRARTDAVTREGPARRHNPVPAGHAGPAHIPGSWVRSPPAPHHLAGMGLDVDEQSQRHPRGTLVAVGEGMVTNKSHDEHGGLVDEARIEVRVTEPGRGSVQRRVGEIEACHLHRRRDFESGDGCGSVETAVE